MERVERFVVTTTSALTKDSEIMKRNKSKCAEALLMFLTNNTCKSVFFFIPKDIADAI